MTARTTRNKIRFQGRAALDDLRRAQDHLTGLAALCDDGSPYVDDHLPVIMLSLDSLKAVLDQFIDGL